MSRFYDVRTYSDGTVYGMSHERGEEYIGCVERRGKVWVALAARGDGVLFEARTRREVLAWIEKNPWGVA
jgi:hypothetical protein